MRRIAAGCRIWKSVFSRWKQPVLFLYVVCGITLIRIGLIWANYNPHLVSPGGASGQSHSESFSAPDRSLPKLEKFQVSSREIGKLEASILKQKAACPTVVRPNKSDIIYQNGYWQAYRRGLEELYVTTAFYDDRPIVGLLPFVRAHVVDSFKSAVHCHVWYSGSEHPYVTSAVVTPTGRGELINGQRYRQNLYSCPLAASYPIPTHLSLAAGSCAPSSVYLEVVAPVRAAWRHEFGVCVAIAFGLIPVAEFVEWIELHRMFGVTEFNVYDGNLSPNMSGVLQYYADRAVLRVFSMPPPVVDFSVKAVKLASPASLNDCMLRNMYRYRYVVVVDFDEVIVPRRHDNYTELVRAIDATERLPRSWQSYTFRNAYFFAHFPEDRSQPAYLPKMRRRHRARPSGYLFAPKSFVDPRACLSVFNHYCWRRFPSSDKRWTIDVNTTLALSHHYRTCNLGRGQCDPAALKPTPDDVLLRFKSALDVNVRAVLKDLGYGALL